MRSGTDRALHVAMKRKEGYRDRMEQKLAGWDGRLEAVRTTGVANAAQLEALTSAGEAARAKLIELGAAAARYGVIRDEMDAAWNRMAAALGALEPVTAAS